MSKKKKKKNSAAAKKNSGANKKADRASEKLSRTELTAKSETEAATDIADTAVSEAEIMEETVSDAVVCPGTNGTKITDSSEIEDAADISEVFEDSEVSEDSEEEDPFDAQALTAAPDVEIPRDPQFSEEDFRLSAEALTAEDIEMNFKRRNGGENTDIPAPAEAEKANVTDGDAPGKSDGTGKKKSGKKKRGAAENILQLALLTVFAAVAIVCVVMLVKNIKGKIDGADVYNNAEFSPFVIGNESVNSFNHPTALSMIGGDTPMLSLYDRIAAGKSAGNSSSDNAYAEKLTAMKASLTALKAKNPDVYGWIYVEGTTIDHPIMRGSDNDYYLNHAYTGEALPIGSIFLDYNTKDKLTDNFNAVIYGHNVVAVSGSKSSMFHDVTKFLDADFFNSNKIYIYTMDGVFIYKAVSIYPTTADYFYYRTEFPNETTFLKFANEMVANSKVPSGETFSSGDTMITLSTCTNGASDGRYALHAKLTEVIK